MTRWLDRVTGKVTMYRLMVYALLAVGVEAVLVSLTGQLAYNPLGILAGGVVAVAACYLSNRLFALIFRVTPHSESSIITGLILLFLYTPALDLSSLGILALAGVIAMASKYLLAIRGRHIFNPAAVGAFVTSILLPQDFPGWWVGDPWLLPLVVVAAFVILFRTRHLTMGVVFVVVAAIGETVQQLSFGVTVGSAISTALVSLPIVYFAGFMLSEPLTLPPRRWQQIALAVVVGVLFSLPGSLRVGPVIWQYAAALLVGNLLAFLVGQRRGIRLEFLGRAPLDSTSWELSFRPLRTLSFRAGQYMELTLPHRPADIRGLRRVFSIASAPAAGDTLRFGLRTATRSSSFKAALLALEPGQRITATTVGGDFVLPRDASVPVLLVAGGIGITPFISHLEQIERTGEKRDVVLVYAASSGDDVAYADRLGDAGHRVLLVAPTAPASLPATWTYLGPGPVTAEMLLAAIPDAKARHAYVSGPPGLVRDLKPALHRAGLRRVHSDYFSGY
jgi:glycine betaine catabolism B